MPDKFPVIILALKSPEPSLNTNVLGVLLDVADVNVLVADCKLLEIVVMLLLVVFKSELSVLTLVTRPETVFLKAR